MTSQSSAYLLHQKLGRNYCRSDHSSQPVFASCKAPGYEGQRRINVRQIRFADSAVYWRAGDAQAAGLIVQHAAASYVVRVSAPVHAFLWT